MLGGTLPDTGQTKCYDDVGNKIIPCPSPGEDFYGQDANYRGLDPSYADNGNGTEAQPCNLIATLRVK